MADIIMPKMGDAMEEGKIVQWLKSVGDSVSEGEAIAEIETDKSNVEIEAPASGTLQTIAFNAGDVAPVGTVIAVVGAGAPATTATPPAPATNGAGNNNGTAPAAEEELTPAPDAEMATPAQIAVVENKPVPSAMAPSPAPAAAASASREAPAFTPYDSFVGALPANLGGSASLIGEPVGGAASTGSERVKATPLARAMAQSHNVDLAALRGTGPEGGIVKADVEAALASGGPLAPTSGGTGAGAPPLAAPSGTPNLGGGGGQIAGAGDEVQEYNAMRRTIAKRLAESKATVPHFYVTSEIDVEAMLALREEVNATSASEGGQAKITLNDFLVKATATALTVHPVVNSVFSDNKRILKAAVNIGIAVSIDDGLLVPVVKNCQTKSLRGIAVETRPLIERARENKLKPDDYSGGTFTISNLGQFDVENFAAIINPGEGAILAISSIRPVAAVVNEAVVPRKRMKVTLCADHRVMDGVAGAQFLQTLKRVIENPLQILV